MPGITRIGDMCVCTCSCHKKPVNTVGFFVQGATTVSAEGLGIVRIGDMAICSCGHPTFVSSSSVTVSAEGKLVARIGDIVTGCPVGTIISGAATVTNNS